MKTSPFFVPFLSIMLVFPYTLIGQLTPTQQATLTTSNVEIPAKYSTQFSSRTVQMPTGFKAKVFYSGNLLNKPRFMSFSPDSILHVANKNGGTVVAMPDRNRDGVADTAYVAADNLSGAHDVRFYRGDMYVALERSVLKLTDGNNDGFYETRTTFIANIASGAQQPGGGHNTRTLVFDDKNQKVYLSIGSLCNVCRESARAIIEEYNIDGTGRRVYATGIRNAVGMTLHPATNSLWANNNGNDNQGNDVPPEWIDIIRDGNFYGYPLTHSYRQWFNFNLGSEYQALRPITATDSALVLKQSAPGALITAHSAPMALEFSNSSFPPQYRNGLWCVLRGSWNRTPATGYKLIYLGFTNAQDTTADFVMDAVTGMFNGTSTWARPVGLALDKRGTIYLGSDENTQVILAISTQSLTSIETTPSLSFSITPNLVSQYFTVDYPLFSGANATQIEVFDALGRLVSSEKMTQSTQFMTTKTLQTGVYVVRVNEGIRFGIQRILIQK